MPVHIVERLQKMNRAEWTSLWTQLGREPTLEEIAEEASLPLTQALEVRAAARASTSLDQPVGEAEDAVFGDFVAGDGPLPEEQVEPAPQPGPERGARGAPSASARSSSSATGSPTPSRRRSRTSDGALGLTRERVR